VHHLMFDDPCGLLWSWRVPEARLLGCGRDEYSIHPNSFGPFIIYIHTQKDTIKQIIAQDYIYNW